MLGLLALGPFLHAHFGSASTEGFHIDGLQWHSHAQDNDTMSFTADDEHDTPAVGISASLTRESHDCPQPQDMLAWACAVVLLVLPQLTRPARRVVSVLPPPPVGPYHWAGHPPPALAPPAHA